MKRFAFIILWLILVAAFTAYGFFGPGFEGQIDGCPFFWDIAWSAALYYGGIGFSVATCILGGLYLSLKVRRGALPKGFGILFVLFWSQIGGILPPVFMSTSGLFQGETDMMIIFQTVLTVGIGVFAFVAFTVAILCIRPVMPNNSLQPTISGQRITPSESDTVKETGPACVRCGKRTPEGSKICPLCGWTQPSIAL